MTPKLYQQIAPLLTPTVDADGNALPITPEQVVNFGMMVPQNKHLALAQLLKEAGYSIYVTVVASHWEEQTVKGKSAPDPEHFEVATVVRHPGPGATTTFSWRVRLEVGESIDSLVSLYAGADWQEREQYDLVGVRFDNHPDLRRLMMPEDWPGHPLRRDYAIDTSHFPWR
ncbi:MAG: NADH-quinone oxidoreductase subunit C [Myxococcota bacterium]|nr:NADH-quinone oxidoreductase subunit C [Myxococcota bacterium]